MSDFPVEIWPIDRLIPYVNNPRVNDDAVDQLASMIHEFGFQVPILAKSDGSMVDGHLRLKAARKLGLTEVPVHLVDNLSDAQIKALRIAINKAAELASWDPEKLKIELEELKIEDVNLEITGFSDTEIEDMLKNVKPLNLDDDGADPGESDGEAKKSEPKESPVSMRGDVWNLGEHRLMCGDCTCAADMEKLMCRERERRKGRSLDHGSAI